MALSSEPCVAIYRGGPLRRSAWWGGGGVGRNDAVNSDRDLQGNGTGSYGRERRGHMSGGWKSRWRCSRRYTTRRINVYKRIMLVLDLSYLGLRVGLNLRWFYVDIIVLLIRICLYEFIV